MQLHKNVAASTQVVSHEEVQQAASKAQTMVAQAPHEGDSGPPAVQTSWQPPPLPPSTGPVPVQVPALQLVPEAQLPHDPPQPSLPQVFAPQLGVHTLQLPLLQIEPLAQAPHEPPQPSSPQVCEPQLGVQLVCSIAAPLGVPMPVGPSHPAPALHKLLPQLSFLPVVTSKKAFVLLYANEFEAEPRPVKA